METIEYRDEVDRTGWPQGEWNGEPDRMQWRDEATGLPCLIVRTKSGHLCGYVGVSKSNVAHGKGYDDVKRADGDYIDVHGGLTYAKACAGRICHVVQPGEDDAIWWFGFDCAHDGDESPGNYAMDAKYGWGSRGGGYRSAGYVKGQCRALAAQLVTATVPTETEEQAKGRPV